MSIATVPSNIRRQIYFGDGPRVTGYPRIFDIVTIGGYYGKCKRCGGSVHGDLEDGKIVKKCLGCNRTGSDVL